MNKIRSDWQLFALLDQPVCNRYWNFGCVTNVPLHRTELDLHWPHGLFLWPCNGGLRFRLWIGDGCGLGGRAVVGDAFRNKCGLVGRTVGDLDCRRSRAERHVGDALGKGNSGVDGWPVGAALESRSGLG